jgi:tetratricopeptide (TPR) repeat protein
LWAWAQVLNKQFHSAMDGLRPYLQSPGFRRLKEVFLTALIRSRQFKKVDEALKRFELLDQTDSNTLFKLYHKTAMEYMLVNEHSKAQTFFNKIMRAADESTDANLQLQALFYQEDYEGFLAQLNKAKETNGILKGRGPV